MAQQPNSAQARTHQLYKRLLWEVRHLWPLLLLSVIGGIIYSACDAYAIYLTKPLINEGFHPETGPQFLKYLAILLLILFVFRGIGSFCSTFFMGTLSANVVRKFRHQIFAKFLNLPASYYDQHNSGKLLSKLLYNVTQVTSATGSAVTKVVQDGAFVIGLLVNLIIISWQLSLIVLVAVPFLGGFIAYVSKRFRRLSRRTQDAMGDITHSAQEALDNYKEIRIFSGSEYQQQKFDQVLEYTYQQQIKIRLLDAVSSPVVQIMGAIALAVIIYTVATVGLAKEGSQGWLTAGGFVAFFSSMMAMLKPVKSLTQVNATIQKAVAATEGIFDIIDTPPEVDQGHYTLPPVKGSVELRNVDFAYSKDGGYALRDISLNVDAGQTVALVGQSGSGKTTLVNLIARFYNPTHGTITIDGVDIENVTLTSLRRQVSLVAQDVNLFDDTIYHNIAYGAQELATEADVIAAAKSANAWDFIQALPNGLATHVGQNGLGLSGGQRQRIAIARALLKNAPILILDEATSALDTESERVVQQALERLMANRTTFVIAHRLSTVEHADTIIVLDQGTLVEQGTHQSLLAAQGTYARLHQQHLI